MATETTTSLRKTARCSGDRAAGAADGQVPRRDSRRLWSRLESETVGAARTLARVLFPSACVACGALSGVGVLRGGVCARCWAGLPPPPPLRCETCDEPLEAAGLPRCGRCLLDPPEFDLLRAAAPYRGSAREILLAFKFRGADYLAPRLAAVLVERLGHPGSSAEVACVPATRKGRRRAGHAAEALAVSVASRLGVPLATRRLEKIRETERQSGLPLSRRPSNVAGAFRVRGAPPRAVLLVDDVATSGATARECARRLRRAGARSVLVWCFARASRAEVRGELPDPDEES